MTDRLIAYAERAWENAKPSFGPWGDVLQEKLDTLSGDRKALMQLALGTLPASDGASVPFDVLLSYADHALMLRESSPFCRDIPEDFFLHHVFYPRINSEDLVDCRPFFYRMLAPLIEGKTGREAALAINLWCAEKMTYTMTDTRSINPLTAFSSGLGRCGEESTFAVTAFRSVGIPARQIYVPFWSHCDDNHAWVEVFTDGGWHFLGACEPEPDLDMGWFVNASGRAMAICSRTFFDFAGEGMKAEPLLMKTGICLAYNQIHRYAKTTRWQVRVVNEASEPVCGAAVRLYVENMAQDACIAALETDRSGCVIFETGLGSCLIEAEKDGLFAFHTTDVPNEKCITCKLNRSCPEEGVFRYDFRAPAPSTPFSSVLSPADQKKKQAQLRQAQEARHAKEQANQKRKYRGCTKELQQILQGAKGHAEELFRFCTEQGEEGLRLLSCLKPKDLWDADPDVLNAHLEEGRALSGRDNPLFLPYVLCPRIGYETISAWRKPILDFLSEEQKQLFARDPFALWDWIKEAFPQRNCRFHPVLWLQPDAALRLHASDQKGRRLLFCAILRTLSVPARLDPIDGRAQFAVGQTFCTVEEEEQAEPLIPLSLKPDSSMVFGQSWGLTRWKNGRQALDLSGENPETLSLPAGRYTLHTVNRLPGGDQLLEQRTFSLREPTVLPVQKRQASANDLLTDLPVTLPHPVSGVTLQFYLNPGAEPTEHCLFELLDAEKQLHTLEQNGLSLQFFIPEQAGCSRPTMQKVKRAFPNALIKVVDFQDGALESLARSLYLEPGLWPLFLLTDGARSFYASGGYCVGSVGLALQLVPLL